MIITNSTNESNDTNKFEFSPTISNFDKDQIEINFNFVDPKQMGLGTEASYMVEIKELTLLKTRITMKSLTPE